MPEEAFVFTERSYQALAAAGINPISATDVLHSRPVIRRHIGASVQFAGRDHHGEWIVVGCVELHDDEYEVTGARRLDDDEIRALTRLLRARSDDE